MALDTLTDEAPTMSDHVTEQMLIGGFLRKPATIPETLAHLSPDACTHPVASAALSAISSLYGAGQTATTNAVRQELITTHRIDPAVASPWLAEATRVAPLTADEVTPLGDRVEDLHRKRQLAEQLHKATLLNADPSSKATDTQASLEATLAQIEADAPLSGTTTFGSDALETAMNTLMARYEGKMPVGIPTGSADLDDVLGGGLEPGRVLIGAGRPGGGKSIFGSDCARAALRAGCGVIYVTLEMGATEVMTRMISAEARIDSKHLRSGRLTDQDLSRLPSAGGALPWDNMAIIDRENLTVELIATLARHQTARFRANGIDRVLIVVDYAQIIPPSVSVMGKNASRQVQLGHISRSLKQMARANDAALVALAQAGRGAQDRPPTLADLRESGDLESDADQVVMLHTPASVDPEDRPGETDFIVAKNRGGEAGRTITRTCRFHYSRFDDFTLTQGA